MRPLEQMWPYVYMRRLTQPRMAAHGRLAIYSMLYTMVLEDYALGTLRFTLLCALRFALCQYLKLVGWLIKTHHPVS